ncbi:uncharacterized protein DS421_18g621980 [Arachis hypogaea]|nr:uncharacterized protein DS421_18g621980 [Arachis hypogaea]
MGAVKTDLYTGRGNRGVNTGTNQQRQRRWVKVDLEAKRGIRDIDTCDEEERRTKVDLEAARRWG